MLNDFQPGVTLGKIANLDLMVSLVEFRTQPIIIMDIRKLIIKNQIIKVEICSKLTRKQ
jgi:hypothetical protein